MEFTIQVITLCDEIKILFRKSDTLHFIHLESVCCSLTWLLDLHLKIDYVRRNKGSALRLMTFVY